MAIHNPVTSLGVDPNGVTRPLAVDSSGRLLTDAYGPDAVVGKQVVTNPLRYDQTGSSYQVNIAANATSVSVVIEASGTVAAKRVRATFGAADQAAADARFANADTDASVVEIPIRSDRATGAQFQFTGATPPTTMFIDSDATAETGDVRVVVIWA